MSEDPEEVHPHYGRSAGLGIEEMASKIPVDKEQESARRKAVHRKNYETCHHEVEPYEQRHLWAMSIIPGHRMHGIVAIMLIAVPMLPIPEESRETSSRLMVAVSNKNVFEVSGHTLRRTTPASGVLPAPYRPLPPKKLK